MFELIVTILIEMITTLQLGRILEFISIGVVIMLLGSPGAVATVLGVSAKTGMYQHFREQNQGQKE